jgi:hypothetical protein
MNERTCLCILFEKLSSQRAGEPSAKVRERMEVARTIQQKRFEGISLQINADSAQPPYGMGPTEIRKFCPIDETSANLLKAAMQHECAGVSSHPQAGSNDCRFGRDGGYSDRTYSRGYSISAQIAWVRSYLYILQG